MKQPFGTIAELVIFIDCIHADNHETLGRWTAAQNFFHLAAAFEGSLRELPVGYPSVVRLMVRPLRFIITRYCFPPWLPIPAAIKSRLEPPANAQFDEQKARLLKAIDAFNTHVGNHPPHPVLGALTRDEWIGFHLRHCAHHLAFIRIVRQARS